jgi:hypothetical protein
MPLLRKLSRGEFCSGEHRLLFLAEQEKLALARLVEAQQRFSQEALGMARGKAQPGEELPPEPGFVPGGPWARFGELKTILRAEPFGWASAASLPQCETSAVVARWEPSQLYRPKAAPASREDVARPGAAARVERVVAARPDLAWPSLAGLAVEAAANPAPRWVSQAILRPLAGRLARANADLRAFDPRRTCCVPGLLLVRTSNLRSGGLTRYKPDPLPLQVSHAPAVIDAGPMAPSAEVRKGALQLRPDPGALLNPGLAIERVESSPLAAPAALRVNGGIAWLVNAFQGNLTATAWPSKPVAPTAALVWTAAPAPTLAAPIPARPLRTKEHLVGFGRRRGTRARAVVPAGVPGSLEARLRSGRLLRAPAQVTPCSPAFSISGGHRIRPAASPAIAGELPSVSARLEEGCGLRVLEACAELSVTQAGARGSDAPRHARTQAIHPEAQAVALDAGPGQAVAALSEAGEPLGLRQDPAVSGFEAGIKHSGDEPQESSFDALVYRGSSGAPGCAPASRHTLFALPARFTVEAGAAGPSLATVHAQWPAGATPVTARRRAEAVTPPELGGRPKGMPLIGPVWAVVGRLRRTAPAGLRWAAAVAAVVAGLSWYTSSVGHTERRVAGSAPEERILAAPPQAASSPLFLTARWDAVRRSIVDRAAIELSDDFRSGLSGWEGKGDWSRSWSYDKAGLARVGGLALLSSSMELADYQFEFLGQIEKKGIAWVYRAEDSDNYYVSKIVIVRPGPLPGAAIVRYAVVNGKEGPHTQLPLPMLVYNDTVFRVRMVLQGSGFTTFIQGQVVDFWSDERFQHGGIGFFNSKGEQSLLRWVIVSHQYDALGRLCAFLAPYSMPSRKGEWSQ